ncbi:HAMP domain-containing protein [Candidatus Woesearchaeota archaeon]|nr:HAMP domain-containing protein [Candidatus Woesearchaeota archaeon]
MEENDKKFGLGSIKTKLALAFGIVLLALISLNVVFLVIHFRIVDAYDRTTDNLVLENRFVELIPNFVQAYYNIINSPKSTERYAAYDKIHKELDDTILQLDVAIVNEKSRVHYRGLRNIITNIMSECDKGLTEIKGGKLIGAIYIYENARKVEYYMIENTASLTVEELAYATRLKEDIQVTHQAMITTGILALALISMACILFAIIFSDTLTRPLAKISLVAKNVAGGNLDTNVEDSLTRRDDEIGSLSKSIESMITNMTYKFIEVESSRKNLAEANADLERIKDDLQRKNEELEKFNKMAVGREIQMVELKRNIDELKIRLASVEKEKGPATFASPIQKKTGVRKKEKRL